MGAGCGGSSEPTLRDAEQLIKRELHADRVRCSSNAPPHSYRCDRERGSDVLPDDGGIAIVKTHGDRIWIADPGS